MRRPRIQITGVTVLILLAIGGLGYGLYELYVPRSASLGDALMVSDWKDAKRWLRVDPRSARVPVMDDSLGIGFPPLYLAVFGDDPELVRMILDRAGDPDSYERGWILVQAAGGAHPHIIRMLLDAGADASERSIFDRSTALHRVASAIQLVDPFTKETPVAREDRAIEIATLLLDHGCPIDARDTCGYTALHHAVSQRALRLADYLIARGADVHLRPERYHEDQYGRWGKYYMERPLETPTLLHCVILADERIEVMQWLLGHAPDLRATCLYRRASSEGHIYGTPVTPIELAIHGDRMDVFMVLDRAERSSEPIALLADRPDLLWKAVQSEDFDLAEALLRRGADPSAAAPTGVSAVTEAMEIDDPDARAGMLDLLRRYGAHTESSDPSIE